MAGKGRAHSGGEAGTLRDGPQPAGESVPSGQGGKLSPEEGRPPSFRPKDLRTQTCTSKCAFSFLPLLGSRAPS